MIGYNGCFVYCMCVLASCSYHLSEINKSTTFVLLFLVCRGHTLYKTLFLQISVRLRGVYCVYRCVCVAVLGGPLKPTRQLRVSRSLCTQRCTSSVRVGLRLDSDVDCKYTPRTKSSRTQWIPYPIMEPWFRHRQRTSNHDRSACGSRAGRLPD